MKDRDQYPSEWRWNEANAAMLEKLLLKAVGTCGGDPVLRPAQASLLARWLSHCGVLVPFILTEDEANSLPIWDGRCVDGDTEGSFFKAAEEVRSALKGIARA